VVLLGLCTLVVKGITWLVQFGPYAVVNRFAAAMAAAALWTTSAIEYVLTARERRRQRQAAADRERQADEAAQELLREDSERRARAAAAQKARAAAAAAARPAPEPEPASPASRPRRRRRPKAQTPAAAPAPARASTPAAAPAAATAPPTTRIPTPPPALAPAPAPSSTKAALKARRREAAAAAEVAAPAPAAKLNNRKARRAAAAAARASAPPAPPPLETDVAALLKRLGLERLEPTFTREQITAEALPLLAATDLVDVGVSTGDAERIIAEVTAPTPTPTVTESVAASTGGVHPENLCCPISMELMQQPVMAADGFTYDRASIEAWLGRGKTSSPTTGAPLPHLGLAPNHLVRSMVVEYLEASQK